jgi:hypothetical protein
MTNQEEIYGCNQVRLTATDAAIREIKVLSVTTSQTQVQKPTAIVRSKDQGPHLEIVNNSITTQDNEEYIEGVDCCSLDESPTCPLTHARGYTNR